VISDPIASLRHDLNKVRSHPLIQSTVPVGGFIYDVDSGLLNPID
jgi:carbonic anhydrase